MESFSHVHRGWRVELGEIATEVMRQAMEANVHAVSEDALFEGLRIDERVDGEYLAVVLGLENGLTTHAIHNPQRMFVESTEEGTEEALRIDSADGKTLLLQFRAAPKPEELDGFAPGEEGDL